MSLHGESTCYLIVALKGEQVSAYIALRVTHYTNISSTLETISQRYHIEISLLDTIPLLSEPGVLLMDMDSTVIEMECIDEIAVLVRKPRLAK